MGLASGEEQEPPTQNRSATRPLSSNQEQKLVDYLEEQLLDITRNFKKRSQPSTTLPTLSSYLLTMHPLLSLVLQIPPLNPSASLRTSLLLRLTGEVMNSIPGYQPDTQTLPQLLAWLDDLDKGWLAALRAQAWDPEQKAGVDVPTPVDEHSLSAMPVSQTDRTRLRSIIVGGTSRMEEWLQELDTEEGDFETTLESLGLQRAFDDMFIRTLTEMGSLNGSMNDPRGMEGTC
ncbi:uncharacterized protein LAESUDRAFT_710756 [Laetiporus sulphureus 93-53]|uniref:Uncharacterized protein n=1 Tax=Laetiporus sulphureus 93-53 TaxID=1314785 RepID=A0A165H2K6_9APHY|nr:uncharacterized protein LAESUDRAFT_710756 [Laetiporus sulphureus 93-53]KZT11159.1 hypothetical protein LAESUDRAFT_710756 [Laetiporus sulphureus 93-53]